MSYENVLNFENYMSQYCTFSDKNLMSLNYIESNSVSFIHAKDLNFAYSYEDDKTMSIWADEHTLCRVLEYFNVDFDVIKNILKHYYNQMLECSLFKSFVNDYDTLTTGGFIAQYSDINKNSKNNSLLGLYVNINFDEQKIIIQSKLNISENDNILMCFEKIQSENQTVKFHHAFNERSISDTDFDYTVTTVDCMLTIIDEHVCRKMKEILLINGHVDYKESIEDLKKELLVLTMINY
jgi:hypothetical protein